MTAQYAFITIRHVRADGTQDTFHTMRVPYQHKPPPSRCRHGKWRTPTSHMVHFNGAWRRVVYRPSRPHALYVPSEPGELITFDGLCD
jgi:hypothetical protein